MLMSFEVVVKQVGCTAWLWSDWVVCGWYLRAVLPRIPAFRINSATRFRLTKTPIFPNSTQMRSAPIILRNLWQLPQCHASAKHNTHSPTPLAPQISGQLETRLCIARWLRMSSVCLLRENAYFFSSLSSSPRICRPISLKSTFPSRFGI